MMVIAMLTTSQTAFLRSCFACRSARLVLLPVAAAEAIRWVKFLKSY